MSSSNFYSYLSENNVSYVVGNPKNVKLIIPKYRSINRQPVLPDQSRMFKSTFKLFWIALLGLFAGGILTLIFSLIVIIQSYRKLTNPNLDIDQRIRAKNFIITSSLLLVISIPFSVLFFIHLFY